MIVEQAFHGMLSCITFRQWLRKTKRKEETTENKTTKTMSYHSGLKTPVSACVRVLVIGRCARFVACCHQSVGCYREKGHVSNVVVESAWGLCRASKNIQHFKNWEFVKVKLCRFENLSFSIWNLPLLLAAISRNYPLLSQTVGRYRKQSVVIAQKYQN